MQRIPHTCTSIRKWNDRKEYVDGDVGGMQHRRRCMLSARVRVYLCVHIDNNNISMFVSQNESTTHARTYTHSSFSPHPYFSPSRSVHVCTGMQVVPSEYVHACIPREPHNKSSSTSQTQQAMTLTNDFCALGKIHFLSREFSSVLSR